MSLIKVDLPYTIFDGATVSFKSPADFSKVTGLRIYYPNTAGAIQAADFTFADANRNDVTNIDKLFGANAIVKVILDTDSNLAFVQNADTNAYLEQRFKNFETDYAKASHIHDDEYYTKAKVDEKLTDANEYTDSKFTLEDISNNFVESSESCVSGISSALRKCGNLISGVMIINGSFDNDTNVIFRIDSKYLPIDSYAYILGIGTSEDGQVSTVYVTFVGKLAMLAPPGKTLKSITINPTYFCK